MVLVRIIAGTYKGHRIQAVPSNATRPTTDKVKEALFQMIGPFFEGGQFLDLFAGSGGLGLEALSRGMHRGIFVDQQSKAIQTIHANIKSLHLKDRTEVYRTDAFRALKAAGKRQLEFDYIFLDPPYTKIAYKKLLEHIESNGLCHRDTLIVCEHDAKEHLADTYNRFRRIRSEVYSNSIAVSIYKIGDDDSE
ncbi:16S rRNA (guanine(966)-N(2))-methyltransferase RsmD [Paraliobacillus ryukyuensis]|uniref:16S rRNA (guanine(966)-N(2))-methyltransferase RsmD n=1 Tax=Paraliobacillus ryukyuensis TaxID=200904 RepID=UPI0009A8B2AA|nr:16S rRNA (guanine(966)-N(2))-methyltransferase RsmD [Paraliobacillus ryukyuensis]